MTVSVIVAPIYTGKTFLLGRSPWVFTRRRRRVFDVDTLVNVHELQRQYGSPDVSWTEQQWAAYNATRRAQVAERVARKCEDDIIVLAHSSTSVENAVVIGYVLIPETVFNSRCHELFYKSGLARMNRDQVQLEAWARRDTPIFSSLSRALEAF